MLILIATLFGVLMRALPRSLTYGSREQGGTGMECGPHRTRPLKAQIVGIWTAG